MVSENDLISRLTVEAARSHLPMWTDWGVRDSGHLVHSLGVTFLTAAGRDLGFSAISEVPPPRDGVLSHVDEDVRSDSLWFDRGSKRVALIAEFERYSGKQKDLSPKVRTLLLAHHRWGCDEAMLLLVYWTIGLTTLPDHKALRGVVSQGFTASGGSNVPGNGRIRLSFCQFVVREDGDGLLRLSSILWRGRP